MADNSYEVRPNSGSLFRNDDKLEKKNEKLPDYTGYIVNEAGERKRLAAWVRESKNGAKYMSLAISDYLKQESKGKDEPAPVFEDDLPF